MENYELGNKLGSGGQGVTYHACKKPVGFSRQVVIKIISCESIKEANEALEEAKVLQRLSHPGIVKYEDVFLDEVDDEMKSGKKKLGKKRGRKLGVCIVMELCDMGDLAACLKDMRDVKKGVVSETVALSWIAGMSSALAYIHGQNTVHRDLKPHNIFIKSWGGDRDTANICCSSVKIGDFGLARQIVATRMSLVGTVCYLAPEVLNSERYADKADIWGLGCIALEILSLNFLWEWKGVPTLKILQEPIRVDHMKREYFPELRQCVAGTTPGASFSLECMHVRNICMCVFFLQAW
jgi:serine/threonine protein kinase